MSSRRIVSFPFSPKQDHKNTEECDVHYESACLNNDPLPELSGLPAEKRSQPEDHDHEENKKDGANRRFWSDVS
jgi:hypothetical protein